MRYNLKSKNFYELNLIDETKRDLVLILPGGGYLYASEREAGVVANTFSDDYHQAIYYYREEQIAYPEIHKEALELLEILKEHEMINRIYIIGFSAGGHFGAMISSLYANYVDKLILCYPVITTNPRYMHYNSFVNLYKKKPTTDELEAVSMEKRIHSQFPPTFIMHTMTDMSVPVENSILFIEALRANNVYCESHLYPTGRHGISVATLEVKYEDMTDKDYIDTYGYISDWTRLAKEFLKRGIK
ncbi:MAG: prolyl oligopeptidase family serine peptidase [Acholeplasmataceae bacterium]|nr:prolyl oligopeptidase family serine peptidase [Acholeplasmataceae bacterium]